MATGQATGEVLAEGKTKIVLATDKPNWVHVRSKDAITAGDGARRDTMQDKAVLATTTTVRCFSLLNHFEIPNHWIGKVDERTFLAERLEMISYEIVMRRIATGSYLKRRPDVTEGTVFKHMVIEFFKKDDAQHDPLAIHDFVTQRVLYFDPKKPVGEGFIEEGPLDLSMQDVRTMRNLGASTFMILEKAWAARDVTLVDLKIECGRRLGGREILVGDVIDNDSWRIWPGGDKGAAKDKQVYRDMDTQVDTAAYAKQLGTIKENYAWVAEQTSHF